jgi:iron complex outermembrane receptor protein
MGNTPRAAGWLGVAAGLCGCALPAVAHAQSIEELRDMPISSLASLDVTSVTKSPAALADAPASIYVITHDDIVRSGSCVSPPISRCCAAARPTCRSRHAAWAATRMRRASPTSCW